MVELLLVREGTSSTEMRSSGPGSPMVRELGRWSSVNEEAAVRERETSKEFEGKSGEGKPELDIEGVSAIT
jgi:hypothetical protein